ncbi:Kinase [Hexamita inflata]|uniref:non-specific serine/threonine protein kinase n=1 Tax=Hexamita inflata TaxID=28002 RepID=A0AA86NGT0_9EUKA|nr:AGC NDR [Hexamita inflata]
MTTNQLQLLCREFKSRVNEFVQNKIEYIQRRSIQFNLYDELIKKSKINQNSSKDADDAAESMEIFIARETLLLRSQRSGVTLKDFEFVAEIGSGAYSVVDLVVYKQNNKLFALKKIYKDRIAKAGEGVQVRTEKAVMMSFNSEFVVKLYHAFQDTDTLYFVMDYASGGDLSHLLNSCGCFPEHWVRRWFAQMICGVLVLHGTDVLDVLDEEDDLGLEERIRQIQQEEEDKLFSARSSKQGLFELSENNQIDNVSSQSFIFGMSSVQFSGSSISSTLQDNSQQLSNKTSQQRTSSISSVSIANNDSFENVAKKSQRKQTLTNITLKQEFIHRDLKPQNFLITNNGNIMLADFGFAKIVRDEKHTHDNELQSQKSIFFAQTKSLVGTLNYISPEQFKSGVYGKCVDFWALGCILYEMLCGEVAFDASDPDDFITKMQTLPWEEIKPKYNEEFQYLSKEAQDLIQQLLTEPDKRLGRSHNMKDLILHPFFTQGESFENIMLVQNQFLKRVIASPDAASEDILMAMPLIPYQPLLLALTAPWKPKINHAADLQYFKEPNDTESSYKDFTNVNFIDSDQFAERNINGQINVDQQCSSSSFSEVQQINTQHTSIQRMSFGLELTSTTLADDTF